MMTANEIRELAKRFFDAVEASDFDTVHRLYADDARIWHNYNEVTQTRDENLHALRTSAEFACDRRYENRRVEVFPDGFVQQHVLLATRADGVRMTLPAAVICRVRKGRIAQLDEYFDPERRAAFRRRL